MSKRKRTPEYSYSALEKADKTLLKKAKPKPTESDNQTFLNQNKEIVW